MERDGGSITLLFYGNIWFKGLLTIGHKLIKFQFQLKKHAFDGFDLVLKSCLVPIGHTLIVNTGLSDFNIIAAAVNTSYSF